MASLSLKSVGTVGKVRILPVVVAAGVCLLVLRSLDFASGYDGVALTSQAQAQASQEAGETAAAESQETSPEAQATPEEATEDPGGRVVELTDDADQTPRSEQALRGLLSERRAALEKREEAINLREQLLKAAELNLEQRLSELRALEERIVKAVEKKEEEERAQLQSLVTMYSNMKPKEAATIFDELNMQVLIEVVKAMNPRNMGAILARMKPDRAQRLTIELARPALEAPDPTVSTDNLPKIGEDTQG